MTKKYNLLFLFADQWRRNSAGFMGKEDVYTPNIDEFTKDSLVFLNAVATGPLCSPSRASILTGTYPQTNGVWTNCKKGLDIALKDSSITITDVLKNSGYYVGYIGKWHLDSPDENREKIPKSGARNWDAYTPPEKRHGVDFWYSYGAYDNHLKPHYWHNSDKMIEIDKWSAEHETDIAIEFIEKNKDKPFSLFISWNPPHTPLDLVPDKYLELYKGKKLRVSENVKYENIIDHPKSMEQALNFTKEEYQEALRKYYAAISGIDDNFGRLIKYLKDNNLYDNTIIVLTADHGEMMCSHSMWSKHVWYEESIGVPFIIRFASGVNKGITDTVLSGVDIMPTLLGLLDLKVPSVVEGKSLSEHIKKGTKLDTDALISCFPGQPSAIEKFDVLGLNSLDYGWRAIRNKNYTYVVNRGYTPYDKKEKLLYNLKEDKYQVHPITTPNAISRELEKRLENYLKKLKDNFDIS